MNCKYIKNLIIEDVTGEITPAHKIKLLNHIKNCKQCQKQYDELKNTNKITKAYFQKTKISYNSELEKTVFEKIYSDKLDVFTLIKHIIYQNRIIKPAIITISLLFLLITGFYFNSISQQKKITNKISNIISIQSSTINFILLNNMDEMINLYVQEKNQIALVNDEKLFSEIKYDLSLYLYTQVDESILYENKQMIDELLDKYTQNYINYFKSNYNTILI